MLVLMPESLSTLKEGVGEHAEDTVEATATDEDVGGVAQGP